jgi:hypothetical protein
VEEPANKGNTANIMAIVFEGLTKCVLCSEVLDTAKEYTMFPPFISNTKDLLYILNDSGVHAECLSKFPYGAKAILLSEKHLKNLPLKSAKCGVDCSTIDNPENIITIDVLTSDEAEELYLYNCLVLNKQNLAKWPDRLEFLRLANEFIKQGKWGSLGSFNYLEYLIKALTI